MLTPGDSSAIARGPISSCARSRSPGSPAKAGGPLRCRPIPLAVANEGCAWRKLATAGIRDARLDARIAYVSDFDTGQLAAVQADLAVAPLPRSYLGPGLVELGPREGFPPLGPAGSR